MIMLYLHVGCHSLYCAFQAAEHVGTLQEETNDDRILQCCLLFHNRGESQSSQVIFIILNVYS